MGRRCGAPARRQSGGWAAGRGGEGPGAGPGRPQRYPRAEGQGPAAAPRWRSRGASPCRAVGLRNVPCPPRRVSPLLPACPPSGAGAVGVGGLPRAVAEAARSGRRVALPGSGAGGTPVVLAVVVRADAEALEDRVSRSEPR